MRISVIAIILFTISNESISQYVTPVWVLQCPGDRYINLYLCGVGIDRDYQTAHEIAMVSALRRTTGEYGLESITVVDRSAISNNSRVQVTMSGSNFIENVRLRDTFYTRRLDGTYEVQVLLSVPKPRELRQPLPSNTGAFLRSAIIPGWGQFYKQRSERGMIFSLIGILSGIVTYNLWSNAYTNEDAHQIAISSSVITAVLHILNIYDATTIHHGIRWY